MTDEDVQSIILEKEKILSEHEIAMYNIELEKIKKKTNEIKNEFGGLMRNYCEKLRNVGQIAYAEEAEEIEGRLLVCKNMKQRSAIIKEFYKLHERIMGDIE